MRVASVVGGRTGAHAGSGPEWTDRDGTEDEGDPEDDPDAAPPRRRPRPPSGAARAGPQHPTSDADRDHHRRARRGRPARPRRPGPGRRRARRSPASRTGSNRAARRCRPSSSAPRRRSSAMFLVELFARVVAAVDALAGWRFQSGHWPMDLAGFRYQAGLRYLGHLPDVVAALAAALDFLVRFAPDVAPRAYGR